MLGRKFQDKEYLISYSQKFVDNYCRARGMSAPLVRCTDVIRSAKGISSASGFDTKSNTILLSSSILLPRFRVQNHMMTVFDVHRLLLHELRHYEQYLSGIRSFGDKTELDADRHSIPSSAEIVSKMDDYTINPTRRKNPEIATATHTGYTYGGKPVYFFDNAYWYMASRHKRMAIALDLNSKHPAHIRKANGWYGRFYQLPEHVSRKIKGK